MNCISNVFNLILLLISTSTLTETAVEPSINCNYLTLNNIFTSPMKQSTHNDIRSENIINFDSNSIPDFWIDQGKSDLPKLQLFCSNSNWQTRLTAKCPISSIDSINSSNCLQGNCRPSRFPTFPDSNQINENAKLDSSLDYSVVSSLIGHIMLLPLNDFGYKTSLIYNASELKSSFIQSLLGEVELKQLTQTFLKLENINEKVDKQSQLIINLINETFKIGQFKALLLSTSTKWSTHYTSSSSIVTTKISLDQVKLNTQNLIRNLFTILIVTNETSKLIFCSNLYSNHRQPLVDSITSTAIVLIMLLTLALIKFTLKRIDLPRKRFKNLIKRNDILLDGTQITFIDVNHSNKTGNFKGEKVYLKRLPDKLLPLKKSTWKLFGQMIDLRNYNLVAFKGLFDNHHIVHHDQVSSTLYPQIGCFTVWEYCARGSLQNIIKSKCIDFDWSFKLSLLFDLSNGLKYLHSTIGKHGWLTSADCVVDNNWLLKITNFGLMTLYQTIFNENSETIDCFQPTSSHLLWSSPEVIKCFVNNNIDDVDWNKNENNNNNTFTCNKNESFKKVTLNPCRWGSKESDVFSLSIIMSELINQSPPYNSQDSITTASIIRSIGSGIFIRPTVDSTDVPDDIIDLMEQCWSDNPDKRPSINDIHDKFSVHSEGKTIIDSMVHKLEKYTINLEAIVASRTLKLEEEMKKTESLLYRMLPVPVADALKLGQTIEPDKFEEVTVYFSDIVGFTTISAYSKPIEIIALLNDLYTSFDRIIDSYQVYKVETIGDAYMVVSGVPERRSDHAEQIADMALDILHSCTQIKIAHLPGVPLKIRIGINTGPVVAGVVGTTMPRYCLFGNTVNIASRMESTGRAYRIQISKRTMRHLQSTGIYHIEYRGEVDLKGRGKKSTYWLTGKDGFNKCLPEPEDDDGANHGFRDCEIIEIFGPNTKTSSDVSPSSPTGSMSPMDVVELNSLTKQNHSTRNVLQVPK